MKKSRKTVPLNTSTHREHRTNTQKQRLTITMGIHNTCVHKRKGTARAE